MTQPLSQRLEEMLASVSGRPITVSDKAEVLMLLSEAAQLAKRVEDGILKQVSQEESLPEAAERLGYYDGKTIALVTLEEP